MNLSDRAKLLGGAKSTIGFIRKKKESTDELNMIERPGRPQEKTSVDDQRIISVVKKNLTSREVRIREGRYVIIKVFNKDTSSLMQKLRVSN